MSLADRIRALAAEGLQINIWVAERGYQVNVKRRADAGWLVILDDDPIAGLEKALAGRVGEVAVGDAFEELFG